MDTIIPIKPQPFKMGWPDAYADFALRWRLIKIRFSKSLPNQEWRSATRLRRGERGIWQRRYWEHLIRDDKDFAAHMDYVHVNPFKHGLVRRVVDWPYSTFHRLVAQGVYPVDWAGGLKGRSIMRSEHAAQCATLIDALRLTALGKSISKYGDKCGFKIFRTMSLWGIGLFN